jgi:hypothetical protein
VLHKYGGILFHCDRYFVILDGSATRVKCLNLGMLPIGGNRKSGPITKYCGIRIDQFIDI